MPATESHTDRVQRIFDAARVKPLDQRDVYLASACGADTALRAEVESLLAHHDRAGDSFLKPADAPNGIRAIPPEHDPRIGRTIAGCLIKSVIDSGGMGTVYLAEQESPRRDVALKIMHHYVASRAALRRFQFESQILAKLRHPNIAQVYLAGMSDDDRDRAPYFVMEYIPGAKTLLDYADGENVGIRERLELFAKVCDAVHHGHQKGVIHRDLKPANILVDAASEPKVIDFGVARSTDADVAVTTQMTEVGQLIGTLQYMSPEQCAADPQEIDTRSDVYSLGVVLFELLTGRLPYDVSHMTIQSAARAICEQAPAVPSAFDRRLRGDLDTIVLKALDKHRDKRYPSAESLAADIRRLLTGEPISAHRPTRWMRVMRWVTRHPKSTTAIASIGIATTVVCATLIGITYLNSQPYEIVLYRNGRPLELGDTGGANEARLYSFSGRHLHTWGGERGSIAFGKLVDRPRELGGGKVAVIGYFREQAGTLRGQLCAYDDAVRDTPIWTRGVQDNDVLSELRSIRGFTGGHFGVGRCDVIDVFSSAENPGDEIVTVFTTPYSQRIVRVYNLAGDLLYQLWHDGETEKFGWMPESRLLVFAGTNARVNWDEFGTPRSDNPDPCVVFALRATPNYKGEHWMPHVPGNAPGDPIWYRWLYSGDDGVGADIASLDVSRAGIAAPAASVQLKLKSRRHTSCALGWDIDSSGAEIDNTRVVDEHYKRNQELPQDDPERLPDPYSFHLRDEPPDWVKKAMAEEAESAASQPAP